MQAKRKETLRLIKGITNGVTGSTGNLTFTKNGEIRIRPLNRRKKKGRS